MKIIKENGLRILASENNKKIRSIDDVYQKEERNELGEIIKKEHQPYYTNKIYLADNVDENNINNIYVEE